MARKQADAPQNDDDYDGDDDGDGGGDDDNDRDDDDDDDDKSLQTRGAMPVTTGRLLSQSCLGFIPQNEASIKHGVKMRMAEPAVPKPANYCGLPRW
jgi:hypothetical protein